MRLNKSDLSPVMRIGQADAQLSAALPVRVQRVDVERPVPMHDHDYVELCVVFRGTAWHRTAAGVAPLSAGDVVAVPPGAVHAFEQPADLHVANVYHLSEWLLADWRTLWEAPALAALVVAPVVFANRRPATARQWALDRRSLAAVKRELTDLAAEREREEPSLLMLRASLLKLLLLLTRGVAHVDEPALPAEVDLTVDAVERAIARGSVFCVEDVADAAGCSSAHLSRRFRATLGEPPTRYFQRRRAQAAAALLLRGDATVTAIAHDLGFADTAHFTRQFKSHTGRTPTDYRKRYTADV